MTPSRSLNEGSSGESVVSRIVRIIDSFDRSVQSLTLTELAARADLPVSTTHRLITEMERFDLIQRDEDRAIRIGPRLWELSAKGSSVLRLREIAFPQLELLMATLRTHVNLAILDGSSVLFLERLSFKGAIPAARTAERFPIHACSPGLVLLAHSTPAHQEQILSQQLEPLTEFTETRPRQLRSLLAEIRAAGIAFAPGVGISEWTGIAVPVLDDTGLAVAAVSVIYPRGHEQLHHADPALRTAARRIAERLADGSGPGVTTQGRAPR